VVPTSGRNHGECVQAHTHPHAPAHTGTRAAGDRMEAHPDGADMASTSSCNCVRQDGCSATAGVEASARRDGGISKGGGILSAVRTVATAAGGFRETKTTRTSPADVTLVRPPCNIRRAKDGPHRPSRLCLLGSRRRRESLLCTQLVAPPGKRTSKRQRLPIPRPIPQRQQMCDWQTSGTPS
jgi:hypothetical protein